MGFLILNCVACSNNPVEKEYIYIKQDIPYSFLEIACTEAPAGETVRSLAMGYVKTRSCLRAHQALIEGIKRNYTEEGRRLDGKDQTINKAPK